MGVPILVSDLPALVEIADEGRCAVFRHEDSSHMADIAEQLFKDPDARAQMIERAQRWVETERTWSANARTLEAAYAQATENFHARKGL